MGFTFLKKPVLNMNVQLIVQSLFLFSVKSKEKHKTFSTALVFHQYFSSHDAHGIVLHTQECALVKTLPSSSVIISYWSRMNIASYKKCLVSPIIDFLLDFFPLGVRTGFSNVDFSQILIIPKFYNKSLLLKVSVDIISFT